MWCLLLGLLLLLVKLLELEPLSELPWAFVAAPFLMAALWWTLSDKLGWTEKSALWRERERKARIRNRQLANQGRPQRLTFGQRLARRWRELYATRMELERQARWERNTEILRSSFYENSGLPETAAAQAGSGNRKSR